MNGFGWIPDLPDIRDYTLFREEVSDKLGGNSIRGLLKSTCKNELPPNEVDLRKWCSEIRRQGGLGSCTAQAAVGLLEYYENRAYGAYTKASPLFLYKVTRNLMQLTGDTGAGIRDVFKALVMFGAPPERYWGYDISRYEEEPSAFLYSLGQNYQALTYYRLDVAGTPPDKLLERIKSTLVSGLPSIFGFVVYDSYTFGDITGEIPFPAITDNMIGGHAVVAVGYDDSKIVFSADGKAFTTGALLIRNSWGEEWGVKGYGWLPYEYVLYSLAVDFWSLIKAEWISI